jgi:23S rRNA pseudouridine2605 synthase
MPKPGSSRPSRPSRPSRSADSARPSRSGPSRFKKDGGRPSPRPSAGPGRGPSKGPRPFQRDDRSGPTDRPGPPAPKRPKGPKPKPSTAEPGQVRLQKVLADAGIASRRESEAIIEAGRVEVNGSVVTALPVFVDPKVDRVSVDGKLVPTRRSDRPGRLSHSAERVYVMLYKPERTLCATRDETPREMGGRKTVLDLVNHPSGARLYPVGRMDYNAKGMVLLTNDGLLAERLTHARYGVGRVYRAVVGGVPPREAIDAIVRRVGKRDAVDMHGNPVPAVRVMKTPDETTRGPKSDNSVLEITLREGRVDPLDEVLHQSGLHVKRLDRIGIGPLRMVGVRVGEWRNLTKDEVASLRAATGLDRPERKDVRTSRPLRPTRGPRPAPKAAGDEPSEASAPGKPPASPPSPLPPPAPERPELEGEG